MNKCSDGLRAKFTVNDVPPKKDGANSMWRKPTEVTRLKSLRRAACAAIGTEIPVASKIELVLRVHADSAMGDLDNFITGVCDGLMAAHPLTPIEEGSWANEPDIHPRRAIACLDDSAISRIIAERVPLDRDNPKYEVEIEWID